MPNTIITSGFQKHVRANAPYRSNTFLENNELILGSSARLRGFTFVSENIGTDVTITSGDFVSVDHGIDITEPSRTSGIFVRTLSNVTIDVSGLTDPKIFARVDDAVEAATNPITFTALDGTDPDPDARHAPLIFRTPSGTWTNNPAIGNDELSNSIILASGQDTVPALTVNGVTVIHNLNLSSYVVFIQPINLSAINITTDGIVAGPEAAEAWVENQTPNSFDVFSGSPDSFDFYWMVTL